MQVSPLHGTKRSARVVSVGLALVLSLALAACRVAPAANSAAVRPGEPRVYFTEPKDGATLSSPVTLKWAAEGIKIEPAADGVKPGSGHLHVLIDTPCLPAGQTTPNDETHIHYGKAQTEATVELKPGTHKLCLQMADAAHVTLPGAGMQQVITLTVK